MVEQNTQGSFIPHGRQDILSTAIGTPEHAGRVRAAGRGMGIRQYFGPPSSSSGLCNKPHVSEVDFQSLKEELTKAIKEELKAELLRELASQSAQPSVPPKDDSPIPQDLTTDADCELYITGPPERLVALGIFYHNYIVAHIFGTILLYCLIILCVP